MEQIYTTLNDSTATIVDDVKVTIVEGDWAKHIAEKIAAATNVSEQELLNLWNDQDYIRSLFDRYPFLTEEMFGQDVRICLEGYLAPNTYIFFQDTTAQEVTEKILNQTLVNYKEVESDIKKSDMSVHQVFTLASVVQYESGKVSEMANIAGVFANRLNTGMPLQSSVTVCYAIDVNKDDDWMACEVNSEFDSPYNTYKYPGLPPGPIQNPGVDALRAVLKPAKHDYYYFMADVYGDGTVYYARTLEEHNANVAKYLK
ncbi:MAG: endolytic transglycosylase MltG [Solobacterium sp.]|nr:endolytic transglycosylase MltG [Solobacterium sp.]